MAKIGKCRLCPPSCRTTLLYGDDVCHHHLNGDGNDIERSVAPDLQKVKAAAAKQKTLNAWYAEQIKLIPAKCENCGKKMGKLPEGMSKRTHVCHIVPKSSVGSVKTHDLNRWFGCWQCHTDFDKKEAAVVAQMRVVKVCRARYRAFAPEITESERKYVPDWLREGK